jgi:hypothetical protein
VSEFNKRDLQRDAQVGLKVLKGNKMKRERTVASVILIWAMMNAASVLYAGPDIVTWERAAFWDGRYPSTWAGGGEAMRDVLEYTGYKILYADELRTWMDARITDGKSSVVVFCKDVAPDTVLESMSSNCTLRRYLNAGGKIVWYADIPMYYQGHADGTLSNYGPDGSINVLGFNAANGSWDSEDEVAFTTDGSKWGLTEKWRSVRPTAAGGLRVLARDNSGNAAAWVKHYIYGDDYRGFVRLYDWIEVSFPVIAGRRTFEWTYSKDGSSSYGSDTAWIDDIVFPVE